MQTSEVSAKLRAWAGEFSTVSGEQVSVPDKLWPFLAQRLVELGVAEEDPDTIVAKIGETWRKVKITGKRGQYLTYEFADGSRGFGMLSIQHVHPESRPKLTAIIDRMVADGRISG